MNRYPTVFPPSFLLPAVMVLLTLITSGCVEGRHTLGPYSPQASRQTEPPVTIRTRSQPARPSAEADDREPAAGRQQMAPPPLDTGEDLLLPLLTHINDRIFAYEQKLNRWRGIEARTSALNLDGKQREKLTRCRQQIEEVLAAYNGLHQRLLARTAVTTGDLVQGDEILRMQKQDLAFTESDCDAMLAGNETAGNILPSNEDLIKQHRQEVRDAWARGDFPGTVTGYERLLAAGERSAPYELTFAYGRALMKTGHEKKAKQVFQDLLKRIRQHDQAQWEFKLMQLIGDLEFALGEYAPARKQYSEITEIYAGLRERNEWAKQQMSALNVADQQSREVHDYADLLRSFLAYNPDRDGFSVLDKAEKFVATYPYSLVAASADHLVTISRQRAEQWYQGILKKVDDLVKQERYEDALLTIEQVPRTILPVEKQQELLERAKEIRVTRAKREEAIKLAREQAMQDSWNTGMAMLKAREYDKAIEAFDKLRGTEYEEKALQRIREAADLAASENRKRAAELFVRSTRTDDLQTRKKLLLASRQLLQDILIKYPQSDLAAKAKRNLKRIEEEMKALDPSLLETPVTVGGAPVPVGSESGIRPTGAETAPAAPAVPQPVPLPDEPAAHPNEAR